MLDRFSSELVIFLGEKAVEGFAPVFFCCPPVVKAGEKLWYILSFEKVAVRFHPLFS